MSNIENPFSLESDKYIKKDPAIERMRVWQEALHIMQDARELKGRLKGGAEVFNQIIDNFESKVAEIELKAREELGKESGDDNAWQSIGEMKEIVIKMADNLKEMEGLIDEFMKTLSASEEGVFKK
jgi:hypothetical protein